MTTLSRILIIFSMWMVLTIPCHATLNVRFFQLSTEQGLGASYVRSVTQDSKGYIWMAATNGLIRYDGYTSKLITPSEKDNRRLLLDERVQTVQAWHDRFIFLRLRGNKYSCYDTQTDCFVDYTGNGTYEEAFRRNYLLANGEIWLTNEKGEGKVVWYDGQKFHSRQTKKGEKLPQEAAPVLPSPYQSLLTPDRTLIKDNRGNLIVASEKGYLWHIDKKTQQLTQLTGVFSEELLQLNATPRYSVVTDKDGVIWVSTSGNGLFAYQPKTNEMTHFLKSGTSISPIQTNFLLGVYEDRAGNIWVCQENMGVTCISKTDIDMEIQYITTAEHVDHSNSIHLLTRQNGQIWIGNRYNTIQRADGLLQNRKTIGNFDDDIVAVCTDQQGNVWMGTRQSGVYAGKQNYRHADNDENSLSFGKISDIVCDHQGRIWISVFNGGIDLAVPDGNGGYSFRHFFRGEYMNIRPREILVDHGGYIWFSSNEGLFVFNPDKLIQNDKAFLHLKADDHNSAYNEIHCIYEDRTHSILAGTTGGGVAEFDNRKPGHPVLLKRYTTADGLPNDNIQQIIQDRDGMVWVGTDMGLACYNHKLKRFMSMMPASTQQGNMFTEHTACLLDNGWLAMGTRHGIITLNPRSVKERTPLFAPHVTDLEVNGVSIFDADDLQNSEALENDTPIRLSHHQNSLTFYFSDFEYTEGVSSRYTYRLAGYDQEWSTLSAYNFAIYRNLSPGTYTIEVKALNSDGVWSDGVTRLSIVIEPPLWATWWAYLIYAILVALTLYNIYKQLRHTQQLRMSIQVEKQLTEYKLRFFTNISHEFRTPLTIINGAMDHLLEQKDTPGYMKQPLSSMRKSVDRMTRLVNQLLEFRKMQSNKLQLSVEETEVISFTRNIFDAFRQMAENKRISYNFIPFSRQYKMYVDRSYLDKMTYNLLSNALKYTPQHGSVILRVVYNEQEKNIRLVVEDTGIGIPTEQRDKLFSQFNQSHIGQDSIGIGLHLTYQLAKAHHGSLDYQENPQGGSIFTITLPIDTAVYADDEFMREDSRFAYDAEDMDDTAWKEYREMAERPMNDCYVLIVDDDDDVRDYLKYELQRYFFCDIAIDGRNALEKIAERKPDLIISDIMMPVMNGFELTNQIRQHQEWGDIPIILLTALTEGNKQLKGINSGADAYLEKPFSTPILIAKCRQLIEQRNRLHQKYNQKSTDDQQPTEIIVDAQEKRFKNQLETWIGAHFNEANLDIDTFAESMGYGRTTFFKKVKKITGMTPNDYIKRYRMEKAAELITDDTLTIAQISYMVGIDDPYYFSKSFKAYYGVSPTQYRKGERGPKSS